MGFKPKRSTTTIMQTIKSKGVAFAVIFTFNQIRDPNSVVNNNTSDLWEEDYNGDGDSQEGWNSVEIAYI